MSLLSLACLAACSSSSGDDVGAAARAGTSAAGPNQAPTLAGAPPLEASQGVEYRFAPSASDADDDELTFSVENLPAWASFDSTTGELSGTPERGDLGETADIVIAVSDGTSVARLAPFSIRITNSPVTITNTKPDTVEWDRLAVGQPVYTDEAIDYSRVPGDFRGLNYLKTRNADRFEAAGSFIEFDVDRPVDVLIGVDSGADAVPAWLDGWTATATAVENSQASQVLYRKRFEPGRIALGGNEIGFSMYMVIVDDGTGFGNSAPDIVGFPPDAIAAGREYRFRPHAEDIDGDAVLFGASSLPAWAALDSDTGEVFGTPDESDTGTAADLVIYASDGDDQRSLPPVTVKVMPAGSNSPPSLAGMPRQTVESGRWIKFVPEAYDPDGDRLRFEALNRPGWARVSPGNGTFAGNPGAADIGLYSDIMVVATDGESAARLPPFSIAVVNRKPARSTANGTGGDNTPPVISGEPDTAAVTGAPWEFTPGATDPDDEFLTFAIENRPAWASFSSSTGRLAGTPGPDDAGSYPGIRISVTDGTATAALGAFTIEVAPGSPPTGTDSGDGTAGGDQDQPATDQDDTAPAGSDSEPTTSPGGGAANTPPVIAGAPPLSAEAGQAWAFTPTASDADGDALTFSVAGRPAWAAFDATTGRLAGTPGATDVATFDNIVITVSDGQSTASLARFSIVVAAAPAGGGGSTGEPPAGDDSPSSPPPADPPPPPEEPEEPSEPPPPDEPPAVNTAPTITGSPADTVQQDELYSFTPAASDAEDDALTFQISNRPPWATFSNASGQLSGTPSGSDVGTYANVVIRVSDGQETTALPAFSISVIATETPNTAPEISGSPESTVLQGQAYSFTPQARDDDDDELSFSVTNRPRWASFSQTTGRLSGTPGADDTGTYDGIVITVSDGQESASLPEFSIEVVPAATGTATLSWTPPTRRTDGSALTNLAGYRAYWGTSRGSYPNSAQIDNPGVTTYVVEDLTPGTWYFVVTAIDSNGRESPESNSASKTIAGQ